MTNPNKPNFRREDRTKKVRLKGKWRRPKGIHSKMRHGFRGRAPTVNAGYKLAEDKRGLDFNNKLLVRISSLAEISSLSPQKHSLIIASAVGTRLRLSIIDSASKAGFSLQNVRKPSEYVASINKRLSEKKEKKQKAKSEKASKEKKKEAKKKEEPQKTEEQKKEEEKLEQEKILTQRTA